MNTTHVNFVQNSVYSVKIVSEPRETASADREDHFVLMATVCSLSFALCGHPFRAVLQAFQSTKGSMLQVTPRSSK